MSGFLPERLERRRGRRPVRGLLIITLGALLLGAAGCGDQALSGGDPAEEAAVPQRLAVITVGLEKWPRVVHVQGVLVADDQVVVGAKVAGRVKDVPVDIGTPVEKKKTVLVTLDTEELRLREEQAKAQLAQVCAKLGLKPDQDESKLVLSEVAAVREAESLRKQAEENWKRAQAIRESRKEAITNEEHEQRKAAWEVAQAKHDSALNDAREQVAVIGVRRAELGLARQVLDDATVLAPFDGIVEHRYVSPGAYLQVGEPVVLLVRIDTLRFRGGVPEREAVLVRVGQKAQVKVEGEAALLAAGVSRVAPALEESNRSLIIEADLPNPKLRLHAGLFAEIDIVVDPEARTLAVPAAAVTEFAGVEKVWLVRDGKAETRIVQTGRRSAELVEILQGVAPGDVVAADARKARRGSRQ